ncbi:MAG TPA: DUF488 domain-containing protein [Flavobacterium sp.]|uniref:DUF488 domain-containing protein n=1 Tax=Flavobacterium sp. TaxID=239 RepID=UPI002C0C3654|nr:DUF488 domain-containing protein [Flavobacterium sp.]HPW98444.1 DUF488 domain-containing protein [Flavobacterium sp.]HQA73292.1 DUF488 domain-containing protein [Flavobacterium sp.]
MYYRRKIILSLLQVFDGELEKIQLQKLLFLFTRFQKDKKTYDFVPYKFGCYSFQANADLSTLKKYGIVSETTKSWKKEDEVNYLTELTKEDKKTISDFRIIYANKTSDDLINLTYKRYPYFAINSTVAKEYLTEEDFKNLDNYRSFEEDITLFTIGYQGITLEAYLNKLIKNNIKVLCDVRKNALSMKYGFSKSQLKNACNGVGIEYIHIPEVGIDSEQRQELKTQTDYDVLFEEYKNLNLKKSINSQTEILNILKKNRRIALTCFEADICQCHRKHLSEAITNLKGFKYTLEHL